MKVYIYLSNILSFIDDKKKIMDPVDSNTQEYSNQ
jgi:hypothetical protein